MNKNRLIQFTMSFTALFLISCSHMSTEAHAGTYHSGHFSIGVPGFSYTTVYTDGYRHRPHRKIIKKHRKLNKKWNRKINKRIKKAQRWHHKPLVKKVIHKKRGKKIVTKCAFGNCRVAKRVKIKKY